MNTRTCLLILLPFVLLMVGCKTKAPAGADVEDLTQWKQLAKEYQKNPAALKTLTEERDEIIQEAQDLESRITELEDEKLNMQTRVSQLEQENMQLNTNLMSAQESVRQLTEQQAEMVARDDGGMMMGTAYRVQIGAYAKNQIPDNLDTGDMMDLEENDGMQKILIGQFRDFEAAKELMTYFHNIGLGDAWVVPYIDGERVSLKEALLSQGIEN